MDALLRERQVRAAKNQALFREVNERIETIGNAVSEEIGYICECLDLECSEQVQLTIEAYEAIRQGGGTLFFIKPGHVDLDVERVIAEHEHHVVVEKIDVGAEIAALLDRRTQDAAI